MKKARKLDGNLTLLVIRSLKTGETLVVTSRQYREAAKSVLAYAKQKQIELAIIQEFNPEGEQTLEKIARALFNPKLIELYPSMRWENLPDDIRKAYLDRASGIITEMKKLGWSPPPSGEFVCYHVTTPDRLQSILEDGLVPNSKPNWFTQRTPYIMLSLYPYWWLYKGKNILLEIKDPSIKQEYFDDPEGLRWDKIIKPEYIHAVINFTVNRSSPKVE